MSIALQYFSKPVVDEIDKIRWQDQSKVAIVSIFKELWNAFRKHEMVSTTQVRLKPEDCLVHPKNRGGLGLNGHNAHKNAAGVDAIGADRSHASKNAFSFQLHPQMSTRQESISFNTNMAAASDELLAPPFGAENHESVGGGHMMGWCRAVKSRKCRTPIKEFQDPQGYIDYARATQDPEMKIMVEDGYDFWSIPWQIAEAFPNVPDIFQKALNAFNAVCCDSSELEVAVQIGTIADQCQGAVDWQQCILSATAANPPCKGYADLLMQLARDYGGGKGMPELKKLDVVMKKWNSNRRVGPVMLKEILSVSFDKIEKYPLVRLGLVLAALTSPTLATDGTANLYSTQDIKKVMKKPCAIANVEVGGINFVCCFKLVSFTYTTPSVKHHM